MVFVGRKKNAKHIVYFGFMNEHRLEGFLKHLDIEYEKKKEWLKKRKELKARCPMHPDAEMVELEGRYTFSELEEECLFVGYSVKPAEILGVDNSG